MCRRHSRADLGGGGTGESALRARARESWHHYASSCIDGMYLGMMSFPKLPLTTVTVRRRAPRVMSREMWSLSPID